MANQYEEVISILEYIGDEYKEDKYYQMARQVEESHTKAKAFDEILEAYKDSSEQDKLVGIFEGQVTTILDEYMEDE